MRAIQNPKNCYQYTSFIKIAVNHHSYNTYINLESSYEKEHVNINIAAKTPSQALKKLARHF